MESLDEFTIKCFSPWNVFYTKSEATEPNHFWGEYHSWMVVIKLGIVPLFHDFCLETLLESVSSQWQPTPVLLPRKSHGRRSLVGCSPWGTKSWARQSDFTFTFHFHALEKEMTSHSSILAWRIPGTEETSGLLSLGSHRVGHDWSDLAAAASLFQLHLFLDCSLLLSAGLQVIFDLSLSSWILSFASYFLIYHPKYFSIYSLLFHHKLIFQR